jgi:murein DD-endopeptidase MepM/ murein hydrolase activator NlpD
MMSARQVTAAAVALLVLALGGSAGAAAQPASSGQAFGIRVVVPGGEGGSAASVSAPPEASGSAPSFAYGNSVATGALSTTSTAAAAASSSTAASTATAAGISLFGGEITVGSATAKATAEAGPNGADGSLGSSTLGGVTILGNSVSPAPNARVALGNWGYAVLLEQAVVRQTDGQFGFRGFVTGLHVVLTAEHGGLPAGSEIMVAYAEAAASAPKPAPPPPPPPPPSPQPQPQPPAPSPAPPAPQPPAAPKPPPAPESKPGKAPPPAQAKAPKPTPPPREPLPTPPGAAPAPPPVVQQPPADVKPQLTAGGYVFPVYGPASFTDDFAAARALTGWHHGNDIFAPAGAPVLAVTDGELFLVGWNDVGGNRLWLRDDQGNEFYYAHLSAYAPVAQDGARVRAGEVIGFVGTTGDAVGTPPHLHFEIHPGGLLWMGYDGVVNPYSYLSAWRRLDDIAFGTWTPPAGEAPPPSAVLLQADDISTASALGEESLARLLAPQDLFGEAPAGPVILAASAGFGP